MRFLTSLGKDVFNELVFMDYFDAFEFRNKKNEIYNKAYSIENNVEDKLRFVTGSDCHQWKYYPYTEENEKTEFRFTYIKSLPTFKGLAMAVTDNHRIELENSFYNPNAKYIPQLIVKVDGIENKIPLSRGLNVIIGDNSIGKSLFLNAITNDCKKVDKRLHAGYEKYINRNKLDFVNYIKEEDIFRFNEQGEIRGIFDSEGLKPDKYLSNYYPNEINASKYRNLVESELQNLYDAIETKFNYDEEIKKLPTFVIPMNESAEKSITFIENANKIDTKDLQKLVDLLGKVMDDFKQILQNEIMEEADKRHIESTLEIFEIMAEKYIQKLEKNKAENEKINVFNTYIKNYKTKYNRKVTDEQSMFSDFLEQKEIAIESMVTLLIKKKNLKKYIPSIPETVIVPETNPVDKYRFVSKLQIEKVDKDYIMEPELFMTPQNGSK